MYDCRQEKEFELVHIFDLNKYLRGTDTKMLKYTKSAYRFVKYE